MVWASQLKNQKRTTEESAAPAKVMDMVTSPRLQFLGQLRNNLLHCILAHAYNVLIIRIKLLYNSIIDKSSL